ncbi:helix-turn-helix domain-containing protein [Streptomyces sp. 1222.5]|uniref:helix-turn-helix domain-containing protein n=1 Tax=Streptomyces sp. 1222.5 TaxID=1881026 RepID=UPI003D73B025
MHKGKWITGSARKDLAKTFAEEYGEGRSIRAIAEAHGRSYGFVHRVLTEAGALHGAAMRVPAPPSRRDDGRLTRAGQPMAQTARWSGWPCRPRYPSPTVLKAPGGSV